MTLLRLLLTSRRTLARAYALARDARVPMRLKVLALVGAVFILSPLNILGDIPFLGILDDAVLLALLVSWFVRAAAPWTAEVAAQTALAEHASFGGRR
jgi:uncharacterized membrane protein YkvA (DUF1232 family)